MLATARSTYSAYSSGCATVLSSPQVCLMTFFRSKNDLGIGKVERWIYLFLEEALSFLEPHFSFFTICFAYLSPNCRCEYARKDAPRQYLCFCGKVVGESG